jgi:hypothetical protein
MESLPEIEAWYVVGGKGCTTRTDFHTLKRLFFVAERAMHPRAEANAAFDIRD